MSTGPGALWILARAVHSHWSREPAAANLSRVTHDAGLLAIAAQLDRHADVLRARSHQVARAAGQTCWASPAGRAWAEDATGIRTALAAGAELTERAAGAFRRIATELAR